MTLVHPLSAGAAAGDTAAVLPAISETGGKGYSLLRMAHAGLRVPAGVILAASFFTPWIEALKRSEAWRDFERADDAQLADACERLKHAAEELELDAQRREAMEHSLDDFEPETLFAVRSSSPEEDLEGSSFAGGYETVLGVRRDLLEAAVRRAFASCLDARIVIYKRQHGFDARAPRIAVVVQQQIASDIAGVGFSINPVSNDFDEAVINANWGLGETVVAGTASPDQFVVDKPARRILDRQIGSKQISIWLSPGGGTEERRDPRCEQACLSDEQVLAVTDQLMRIEQLYQKPMDIEWAFAEAELYLLQARPITAFTPVPPALLTAPGEARRLYLDATISVQGLLKPLSVMGSDVLRRLLSEASREVFGRDLSATIDGTLAYATAGRMYLNLSNLFGLLGRDPLAEMLMLMDSLAASSVRAADERRYRRTAVSKTKLALMALPRMPPRVLRLLAGKLRPRRARRDCLARAETFTSRTQQLAQASDRPMQQRIDALMVAACRFIFRETLPLVLASRQALAVVGELVATLDPGKRDGLDALDRSLPGNVTVEMGLALEGLAGALGDGPRGGSPGQDAASWDGPSLNTALKNDELPAPFTARWHDFLERYGHRGPRELDVAAPRFVDRPELLLGQIAQLRAAVDSDDSPSKVFARSQTLRQATFERLEQAIAGQSRTRARRFRSAYAVMTTLGGLREAHKYYMIFVLNLVRRLLLDRAATLLAADRLSTIEQLFDLELDDLERAEHDPSLDLVALGAKRRAFHDRLAALPQLPTVFDSRGRIFRPAPPAARPGEIAGQPISAGVAQGPVKVLHRPDEKPVEPGDILVAHATDPGWTPLFVNAAAIVLEVGGMLQHGALVAREYGKPCVAGVIGATTKLRDGERVEVDGAAGIVRRLPE